MIKFDTLNKISTTIIFSTLLSFTVSAGEIPKAVAIEEGEAPQGILYRINKKTGEVVATPLSSKLLNEHNIEGKEISDEQLKLLAGIDSRNALPKGVALKAVKRTSSSDEFNDADAAAKPALYFSFGFGRPYWGGYRPYYNNYNYAYNRPYYYGGYYAPRVMYYGNTWYNPVYRPCNYGNYYYSYYSCGGCW